MREIDARIDAGRYAEAYALAAAVVAATGESSSVQARAPALAALADAAWRDGRASADALAMARQAAEAARALGDIHTRARTERSLGRMLILAARPADAVRGLAAAVKLYERTASSDPRVLADLLEAYGLALIEVDEYDQAASVLRRWTNLANDIGLDAGRARARAAATEALLMLRMGRYDEARVSVDGALRFWADAPVHPDAAAASALSGDLLWLEGRPAAARAAYGRCVDVTTAFLRSGHPDVADCTRRVGNALARVGDLAEALRFLQGAADAAEAAFGAEHPAFSGYLNDLAAVHLKVHDYRRARDLYERALTIREGRLGPDHQDLATIAYNLGLVSGQLGDLGEARRQFERARHIWSKRGADHPFVALAMDSLADALAEGGARDEALSLRRGVLAMRERTVGPAHPDTANALNDLAATLLANGDAGEAARLTARAMTIWEHADGSDTLGLVSALTLRADVQSAIGEPVSAQRTYDRALGLVRRVLSDEHPTTAELELRLASMALRSGLVGTAFDRAFAATSASRRFFQSTIQYLPEREALSYGRSRPSGLGLLVSMARRQRPGASRLVRETLDATIKERALVLDMAAGRRRRSRSSSDPKRQVLSDEWLAARQRLANLAVMQLDGQSSPEYGSLVQDARRSAEALERRIAVVDDAATASRPAADVGVLQVQAALPPASVLVSFVRYDDTPPTRAAARPRPSYAAFVMARSGIPTVVPIGPADVVEAEIAAWRAGLRTMTEGELRGPGLALRRRLWTPLEPSLRHAAQIFVVPDGAIHLVNLSALPSGDTGYLVDEGRPVHYLSSERDLVTAGQRTGHGDGLLVIGGVTFDGDTRSARAPAGDAAPLVASRALPCGSLEGHRFETLPATAEEVRDVAALWTAVTATERGRLDVLSDAAATERAVKQAAPRRRILHLATHGYFLGGECDVSAGSRGVGRVSRPLTAGLPEDSPLLLSGLALAGVNARRSSPDGDDGLLTAEEVAALDLEGTEWAVLSACDTGVGEPRAGEGVLGLRRAFEIAGARTVIMSLWAVEDSTTRTWMRALYEGRFRDRRSSADAVHYANGTVLRGRRASGLDTHPRSWAPFVAAGDWR